MAWRIERQSNGLFAIYSTRLDDYIVIDADELQIAQLYAEKGVKVYLASARTQMTTSLTHVPADGDRKPLQLRLHRRDHADVAVEHLLVVVVLRLHHFVVRTKEHAIRPLDSRIVPGRRIQRILQRGIESIDADGAFAYRRQH